MDSVNLFNPVVLVLLLAVLYFWNGYNAKNKRKKNKRSFRKRYNDKKKENNS